MLFTGGGAWLALRQPKSQYRNTPQPQISVDGFNARQVDWTNRTDAAIADLQTELTQNESRLDTSTVRVVRQNLAIIDRAIADARAALQKDPSNTYLNLHLADTMRRKVDLLRRVNDLAARS